MSWPARALVARIAAIEGAAVLRFFFLQYPETFPVSSLGADSMIWRAGLVVGTLMGLAVSARLHWSTMNGALCLAAPNPPPGS